MKRIIKTFGILSLLLLLITAVEAQDNGLVRKVVIDAGHGGRDPGAIGKYSKEKDIALSIALKTGHYIEKYLPDVEVIYTRKTDKFIELYKRTEIANKNNADLFISIHCNAIGSSKIYGAETYVMGLHKSKENLEVAKLENASILKEENYIDQYEGFNPNSPEAYIIFNLYQDAFLDQSLNFASMVQDQFRERVGLKDRSVMQAGFLVLYKTTMPAVLIETGYLTNKQDEKFLTSEKGQVYIASAIYRAFKEYKKKIEKNYSPEKLIAENQPLKENNKTGGDPTDKVPQKTPIEEDNKNNKEEPAPVKDELIFRVQFATSKTDKSLYSSDFNGLTNIWKYHHNGLYKYTTGSLSSFNAANKLKNQVRNKGYKDAFVVAFLNNQRINISKAKKLSKN